MYIISFNIMYNDNSIILTESPCLYMNNNLSKIMVEIRNLIRNEFLNIAEQYKIPVNKLSISMTTLVVTGDNVIMNFFWLNNIRDKNKLI